MPRKKYNLKLAVLKRWLRTILPQVPAAVVVVAGYADKLDAPSWIVPALMFVGTVATAADKLYRELHK